MGQCRSGRVPVEVELREVQPARVLVLVGGERAPERGQQLGIALVAPLHW